MGGCGRGRSPVAVAGGAPSPRRGRGLGQAVATEAEKLGGGVRSGGTRRDAEAVVFPRPRSGGVLRRSSRWGWRTTGHLPSAGGSGPPRSRRGRPRWPSRGGLREPEAFGEGLQSGTWRTGLPRFPVPPPPSQGFGSVVSRRGAPAGAALQRLRGRQRAPGPRPPPPVQGSASEVFSAEKFSQPENRSFPALKNFKCCAQRTVLMLQRPDPVSPTPWATGPKLWRPRFPPVPSKVSRVQGFSASKRHRTMKCHRTMKGVSKDKRSKHGVHRSMKNRSGQNSLSRIGPVDTVLQGQECPRRWPC